MRYLLLAALLSACGASPCALPPSEYPDACAPGYYACDISYGSTLCTPTPCDEIECPEE